MTKNPPNQDTSPPAPAARASDELAAFGFDDPKESWLRSVADAEQPTRLGELGHFQLLSEVGRGGQGIVYRAWDHANRREVALKRLIAGRFSSENARRRLMTEVTILARLDHAGIVRSYGLEWIDDSPLLVLEWIDGSPITSWSASRSIRQRVHQFVLVCDAVHSAHRHGVLHCDLKPSNVLVDAGDRVFVLDFGLARFAGGDDDATPASFGTPGYAAPEQLAIDPPPLDVRADVYALGVVLYECLAGRSPHPGSESLDASLHATREVIPAPPGVDRELDAIVLRALEKERAKRYSTVDDLARDLRNWLDGRPVSAVPQTAWYVGTKFASRRRGMVAAGLAAIVVLIAFGVHGEMTSRRLAVERNAAIEARAEETRQRAIAEAVRDFALNDLVPALDPQHPLHAQSLEELLEGAEERIHEQFADLPIAEAAVLQTLAEVSRNAGRLVLSERVLLRAHQIALSLGDEGAEVRANVAMSLGRILAQFGRRAEAIVFLREADAWFSADAEFAVLAAITKNDLGVCHLNQGDLEAAKRLFRDAMALQEAHLGRAHFHTARTMQNLAEALQAGRDIDAASALYEEAEGILRNAAGDDSPMVAEVLFHRAKIESGRGNDERAETYFRDALAIQRAKLPTAHPVTARVLAEFGDFLMRRARFDEGVEALRERHAMIATLLPPGSDGAIDAAQRLVRALLHTASARAHLRQDGAGKLREEARIVADSVLGSSDPLRTAAINDCAKLDSEP